MSGGLNYFNAFTGYFLQPLRKLKRQQFTKQ